MSEEWGGHGRNVYYEPAACGLELLATLMDDEPYEFSIVLLLRDGERRLYLVYDSGCSCPTPFEDVNSFADLTPLTEYEQAHGFLRALRSGAWSPWSAADELAFLGRCRAELAA